MANYKCMGCMQDYDDSLVVCPFCAKEKGFQQKEPYFLPCETVLDNRYIVGKALGNSAFSITYLAWDFAEECKVVIKEYFPQNFASRMPGQKELNTYDGEKERQFEAGLVAFVEENSHLQEVSQNLEGIAKVKGTIIENSTAYVVMEYIDGVTLDKALAGQAISWKDAFQIMEPVVSSMAVIHDAGLINFNIAPDNIIMTRDRKVKLLGFGSSKLATSGKNVNLDMIIKPGFSPEEMYHNGVGSNACIDVYSLAAVMYFAITGQVPQYAIDRVQNDTLASPIQLGVKIPVNANIAIMNALNVNPEMRTQSCGAFLAEITSKEEVVRREEIKKKDDTGKLGKKSIILICVAVAVLIAAIVGISVAVGSGVSKVSSGESGIVMKDLTKMNYDDAIKFLDDNEIIYEMSDPETDKSLADGEQKIVYQSIDKGTPLEQIDGKLKITKAIAPAREGVVPDLISLPKSDAKKKLEDAGFTNYEFEVENNNNVHENSVCDQSISAGKKATADKKIVVYVAKHYATTTKARVNITQGKKYGVKKTTTTKKAGGAIENPTKKTTKKSTPKATTKATTKKRTTKKATTKPATTKKITTKASSGAGTNSDKTTTSPFDDE